MQLKLEQHRLLMTKVLWAEEELFLARCYWFKVHTVGKETVVEADLTITFRKAVYVFINHCFKPFVNNPNYSDLKDKLFKDIDNAYKLIWVHYTTKHKDLIPFYDKLKLHQRQALVATHRRKSTLLSLEQGLGKTITSYSIGLASSVQRIGVVCMDIGKWNYMNDITDDKWAQAGRHIEQYNFTIYSAQKHKTMVAFDEKITICNYDSLHKYVDKMSEGPPLGLIVIDECQAIKDPSTARYKAVQHLVNNNPNAKLLPMSGTPMMNRFVDMFGYFKLTGHPLGVSAADFKRQFAITNSYNKVTDNSGHDKLALYNANFIFRKTQKECGDLPPAHPVKIEIPLGDMEGEYRKALREAMLSGRKTINQSNIQSINRIMANAKVPGICDMIDEIISTGDKVVVFFSYTDPIRAIKQRYGDKCLYIDGSIIDGKEKVDIANKFQTDDNIKILVANMKAAGHTITLTASNKLIIGNYPLTPKDMEQAIYRVLRYSQTKAVEIYLTCVTGSGEMPTVDERMYEMTTSKIKDIDAVLDGKSVVLDEESFTTKLWNQVIEDFKAYAEEKQEQQTQDA